MGTVTQYNLANVQSALGGSNPISMSEYYRGGAYMPTTRTVTQNLNGSEGPLFVPGNPKRNWVIVANTAYLAWFGTYNGSTPNTGIFVGVSPGNITSYYNATYSTGTYYRGPFQYNSYNSYYGGQDANYAISRSGAYTLVSTQSINTGVPSSGAIAISQLYGAANP
jgi:hypothetical protein